MDPNKKPIPKNNITYPVTIGFLMWAYGPVLTRFIGGEKGTGVPFALTKSRDDHIIKNSPRMRTGTDTKMLSWLESILGNFNTLSNARENKIKTKQKIMKAPPPIGVRRIRIFLLPVAAL